MGILDFLGPTSWTKRRGWDALPAATAPPPGTRTFSTGDVFFPSAMSRSFPTAPSEQNSAVFACLQAIATAVAEPELRVYRAVDGDRVALDGTPLGALLARPNPQFTLDQLLGYLATSLHVDGNAYWRLVRAAAGNVLEVWPVAPRDITPSTAPGSTELISSYRYAAAGGRADELPPADVVHFRYGIDDADHRLGLAPLKRLVREVSSDEQATRYADRLLANLAINGLTLSFDKEAPPISQEQADQLKARISAAYGGDNVGATAVLSPGAELSALGFSPEQMDLGTLHRVPEERICAVLGVPAAMIGLGVGLEHSIYNNVKQAEEHFTERKLLPLWAMIAAEITLRLVPQFTDDASILVDFDTSTVRALAEDRTAEAARLQTLVASGILTRDEARAELGLAPLPEPEAAPPPIVLTEPVAASRRPPAIRALGGSSRKDLEQVPGELERLREDDEAAWVAAVAGYLTAQRGRVLRGHRAGIDDADALVPEAEAALLALALAPLRIRLLGSTTGMLARELSTPIALDDILTQFYLQSSAESVVGITATTRAAVRAALLEGQALGEGAEALALRLGRLPAFSAHRAATIARTELAAASVEASYAGYVASGVVVGVVVRDGDYDPPCAERDGTVLTLDEARTAPRLLHPNCTVRFEPRLAEPADGELTA